VENFQMNKKLLALMTAGIISSSAAYADGLYLQANAGYGTTGSDLNLDQTMALAASKTSTTDDHTLFGASMGYMIDVTPRFHMGPEIGFTTLSSQSVSSSYYQTKTHFTPAAVKYDEVEMKRALKTYKSAYAKEYKEQMQKNKAAAAASYNQSNFAQKHPHCINYHSNPRCAALVNQYENAYMVKHTFDYMRENHPEFQKPDFAPVRYTYKNMVQNSTATIDTASMVDLALMMRYDLSKHFDIGGGVGMAYVMSSVNGVWSGYKVSKNDKARDDFKAYNDGVSYDSKSWQPEVKFNVDYKITQSFLVGLKYTHIFGDNVDMSDVMNQANVKPSYDIYQLTATYQF
jgi:hypothetical protein